MVFLFVGIRWFGKTELVEHEVVFNCLNVEYVESNGMSAEERPAYHDKLCYIVLRRCMGPGAKI